MHERQREAPIASGQGRRNSSAPDRQNFSGQDRKGTSAPIVKKNQVEGESKEGEHTHSGHGLPQSLEAALEVARQLGIEAQFAGQEYHSKKSVSWKDGYGNSITSWADHLLARWPVEQRRRTERRSTCRSSAKRPASPPRQFDPNDYKQSLEEF
jgi:hypothetical protein